MAVALLCLVVVAGGTALLAAGTASAGPVLDGMAGNGTANDPYVITNATELQAMNESLSAHYVLGNTFDAANTATWNGGSGFAPVGDSSTPFDGSLDGRGHAIANLTIDRSSQNEVGLFGRVGSGSVANLTLENASVTGDDTVGTLIGESLAGASVTNVSASGTVTSSGNNIGGLIGENSGNVTDSSTSGNVTGDGRVGGLIGDNDNDGTVTNSYATGTVTGGGGLGGLVGSNDNDGTVTDSFATGTVTGSRDSVGGLVGVNFASVNASYATGNVTGQVDVGGLVGYNTDFGTPTTYAASVTNSYATGTVTGSDDVGGLIGETEGGSVTASFATGNVSGNTDLGGLVGSQFGGSPTIEDSYWDVNTTNQTTSVGSPNSDGLTTAEMSGAAAETNMTGFDFDDVWTLTDSYPHLRWEVTDLTLVLASTTLNKSETTQATVTLSLSDGQAVTATTVANYTSDDESVATAATNGTITAEDGGTANLTATVVEQDAVAITVFEYVVSGTVLDGTLGDPVENATVTFDDGTVVTRTTNASGGYNVMLLEGTYEVSATATVNGRSLRGSTSLDLAANTTGVNVTVWDVMAGNGTAGTPFEVDDVYLFQSVAGNPSANYTLSSDVDASDTSNWNGGAGFDPIGDLTTPFNGSFDGGGHTISNLTIDRSGEDYVGFFGVMTSSDSVANVTLENVSVTGGDFVGGLVGNSTGTVTNASVTGTVTGDDTVGGLVGYNVGVNAIIANSSANATVNGTDGVGGLVGENSQGTVKNSTGGGSVTGNVDVGGLVGSHEDGIVANSSASGAVTGSGDVGGLVGTNGHGSVTTDSSASGNVTGDDDVGGLVGLDNGGSVIDAYATGTVDGATDVGGLVGVTFGSVTGSYAAGAVNGSGNRVGGLVGTIDFASATDSYATGSVTGENHVGGLVGRIDRGSVTTSYANGFVSGENSVGGLVGSMFGGLATVDDSYWDVNTSNQTSSIRGTGLPTVNMTGAAAETNMTGFDFDDTWTTTDAYPHLRWEVEDLTVDLDSTTLEVGDTTQATVTLSLASGSNVSATTVANYTSDDASVATLGSPTVTAQDPGSTNVTAEHADHNDLVALTVIAAGGGSGGDEGSDGDGGSDDDDDSPTTGCAPSTALENADVEVGFDGEILCVRIAFVADDNSGSVTVDVLDTLPDGVDPLPGTMGLIFVDVTVPPAPTDSEATMQLTLDATALDGIDPADLVVSHHDGGEWAALETTVVWSGGDQVVIETTTPGFSLFAVAPAVQQTTQDEGAGTPDDTTPDVGTATPGSAGETATAVPEVEEPAGFDPLPLVLLAVVVIALSLVAVHRRS